MERTDEEFLEDLIRREEAIEDEIRNLLPGFTWTVPSDQPSTSSTCFIGKHGHWRIEVKVDGKRVQAIARNTSPEQTHVIRELSSELARTAAEHATRSILERPSAHGASDPDRVVTLYDPSTGECYDLPERPGPFTIGGPGADVCLPGLDGIAAIGEVQEDGSLLVRYTSSIGRNELCPCGSGRKFKRCCAN